MWDEAIYMNLFKKQNYSDDDSVCQALGVGIAYTYKGVSWEIEKWFLILIIALVTESNACVKIQRKPHFKKVTTIV